MDNENDWQNDCPDIKSRGKNILEKELWSDCRFLVGAKKQNQKLFSGHKLILAMASPVFERMFYGNFNNDIDPIVIPDTTPDIFRIMIKYIYTDKIEIHSFEEARELGYVAKKYMLPYLIKQCTNYMFQNLNTANACKVYEFACLFDEFVLKKRCLQLISSRTRKILADESFMEIKLSTLLTIFSLDQLNIESELDLFNALNDYAIRNGYVSPPTVNENNSNELKLLDDIKENVNGNINENVDNVLSDDSTTSIKDVISSSQNVSGFDDVTNKSTIQNNANAQKDLSKCSPKKVESSVNVQEILSNSVNDLKLVYLKDAIGKIRFLTLNPQKFSEIPGNSELLSDSETLAIIMNILNPTCTRPIPDGLCTFRVTRNYSPPVQNLKTKCGGDFIMTVNLYNNFFSNCVAINCPTKIQNINIVKQQMTDFEMTLNVDSNIMITGLKIPTQWSGSNLLRSEYTEFLYIHLLDDQGSRLSYIHYTSKVSHNSFMPISFDEPVFIQENKMYKIGIAFNKAGSYPLYTCYPEVTHDNVNFTFYIEGADNSLRAGLIREILFKQPKKSMI